MKGVGEQSAKQRPPLGPLISRPRRLNSRLEQMGLLLPAQLYVLLCGKNMALNDIERKRIQNLLGAFVEKFRPPSHIRPQLDFGFRITGQSIELFEIRPQWNKPEIQHESSFAKATFVRAQGMWRVNWQRADLKWHGYEPVPGVSTVEEFLAIVKKDEYACFLG